MQAQCEVLASRPLTPTTHLLRLTRPDGFAFTAGQHVLMQLDADDGPEDRFLSIASAPHQEHLEFAVRLSGSAFKHAFCSAGPGTPIRITGPAGRFTRDDTRPAVLLSGGIGITPLRSMILDAAARRLPPTRLIYGNREPSDIPFHDELDALRSERIDVTHTVDAAPPSWTGHRGHITAALVRSQTQDLDRPVHYVCGPPGMVAALTRMLADNDDVRVENFTGY